MGGGVTIRARRLQLILAVGLLVFVAGIVRDLAWHATHDTQREFETAATQVAVHWLPWLGGLILLIAGAIALRRSDTGAGYRGYWIAVLSGGVYAMVSVWHFIEHANGNDPQVAHLLLYLSAVGMTAGTVMGLASARRGATSLRA